MRSVRYILLLSLVAGIGVLGYLAYQTFYGPNGFRFSGDNWSQLLQNENVLTFFGVLFSLVVAILIMRPFLRIFFPAAIKNAVTAEAKVLKVWDTGTTVNENPQIGLLLEFNSAEGVPLQAEAKTIVSRLDAALIQPGITAEIEYDAQKPQSVRVATLHVKSAAPTGAVARMEELNELRAKGMITEEEYQQKRQEILNAL